LFAGQVRAVLRNVFCLVSILFVVAICLEELFWYRVIYLEYAFYVTILLGFLYLFAEPIDVHS
jgi:hypothetical protein